MEVLMIRYAAIALAWASLMSGAAVASPLLNAARPATVHGQRAWMRADANPHHTWMYLSGFNNDTVGIYDLDKIGAPQIGQITDGLNGPAGIALDAHGY